MWCLLWNTNPVIPNVTSFLPQCYVLTMTSYSLKHPLGHLAVPVVFPPNSPCTPSLLASMAVQEAEKALALCRSCSAITKVRPYFSYAVLSRNPKHSSLPCHKWHLDDKLSFKHRLFTNSLQVLRLCCKTYEKNMHLRHISNYMNLSISLKRNP